MKLFLDVPYNQKDEVKALGARWNPKIRKWYITDENEEYTYENYEIFAKYILGNRDSVVVATDYLYILETTRECWRCHNKTRVIGLGVGDHFDIYKDFNGNIEWCIWEDTIPYENIYLSWAYKEDDIPPKILRYLKKHYSVRTGYSKFCNGYTFANHCDCCNALQGNWFLFNEPDSPLSTCTDGTDLINRMMKIRIKQIPIYDDLILHWEVTHCQNDYAYFEYSSIEKLILSGDPRNEYITYEELYS